ncbi:MAG: DUF1800 family protein [Myxococcota bacterium]
MSARDATEEEEEDHDILESEAATFGFWVHAIRGPDQLRQRMAFALSQLLVVSNFGGEVLTDIPDAVIAYQDLLIRGAFGNYRDLLEQVTYSPAMGHYLTYMGNQKADPITGRVPDENYAREILQLFSIGVVRLQMNGEPVFDSQGQTQETYTNEDITGLAKVFTGLFFAREDFGSDAELAEGELWRLPMEMYAEEHSLAEKRFLGTTIPANTPGRESITLALDAIFAHENVAPFVSRQLIQRFITSDPKPEYIERVASAFAAGRYRLPDGSEIGDGRRGDLSATLAAILFDVEARDSGAAGASGFGKVRETVIRIANWARAFGLQNVRPEYVGTLYSTDTPEALNQHPYRSRSVFNFYRPGYVAPSTLTGNAGLTMPELQLINATSTPGYINTLQAILFRSAEDVQELLTEIEEEGLSLDAAEATTAFLPDHTADLALAGTPRAMVERMDELLSYGSMPEATKTFIAETVALVPMESDPEEDLSGPDLRVRLAIFLMMTSPEFLVQR